MSGITETALLAAVRAALAIEQLVDLRDSGVVSSIRELVHLGGVRPEVVMELHAKARDDGRAVRGVGELVDGNAPALQDMRRQLHREGATDAQIDSALRSILLSGAN
jgi:hypothetical protein